jgi:hypothetical protein
VGGGEETVDLRVEYQLRLAEIVDEVLADPGSSHGGGLVVLLAQGTSELIAGLGQPRVADDETRWSAPHLLDHIAATGPQVLKVGHIGLDRKGVDAGCLQLVDQIEAIVVAAMEMNADRGGAVQSRSQSEGLSDSAVLAGPGDEHALAIECWGVVG